MNVIIRAGTALITATALVGCGSGAGVGTPSVVNETMTSPVPTAAAPAESALVSPTESTTEPSPTAPDSTTSLPSTTAETTAEIAVDLVWEQVDLGDVVVPEVLAVATIPGRATMLFQPAPEPFQSAVITDEAVTLTDVGQFGATGPEAFLRVTAMAATSHGFVALGTEYASMLPVVLTSPDGAGWTRAAASGFDEPADMTFVIATDAWLVAAGALRTAADPRDGGFEAAIWRSVDGLSWERSAVEGGAGGYVSAVAAAPEGLVAIGGREAQAAVWRSEDDGATWNEVDLGVDVQGLASLTTFDGSVIAVGASRGDTPPGEITLVRSDDSGRTWSRVPLDPLLFDAVQPYGQVVDAGGALWLSATRFYSGFDDPDACYRDIGQCGRGARPVLFRSDAGESWDEIDLTLLSTHEFFRVHRIAPFDDGLLVIASAQELAAWRWDSDVVPPVLPPPSEPEPLDTPLATWGQDLELGRTYRFPLYIHCGMDVLGEFNGTPWHRVLADDGANPETGAGDDVPDSWPHADQMIFGYITLVDDDTIEYSIADGELIATYAPSDEPVPGCA